MINTTSIITLIVLLVLAIIPAVIANKKYYSAVGFYIYGVLAFLPALIHVICLPDQSVRNAKRASAGAIVLGALTGMVAMYSAFTDVISLMGHFQSQSPVGYIVVWALCEIIPITMSIWLLICVFRCDRNKSIMLNFIFSAVAVIAIRILSTIMVVIIMNSNGRSSIPIWNIMFTRGRLIFESVVYCVAYLVFALFIYRLNAGQSVMPKAFFCLAPGIAVLVMLVFDNVLNSGYGHNEDLVATFLVILRFFFIGGYLWAVSNIPSNPVVEQNAYEEIQQ